MLDLDTVLLSWKPLKKLRKSFSVVQNSRPETSTRTGFDSKISDFVRVYKTSTFVGADCFGTTGAIDLTGHARLAGAGLLVLEAGVLASLA